MSFEKDIAKFAKSVGSNVEEATKAVKFSLFNSIIKDTRVDTGRLRGNWQTSTDTPKLNEIDRLDTATQGTNGGKAQDEVAQTITGDRTDYLTNNLPYAEVYEEKDGMIAKNMARIDRIIKESVTIDDLQE